MSFLVALASVVLLLVLILLELDETKPKDVLGVNDEQVVVVDASRWRMIAADDEILLMSVEEVRWLAAN